jgi:hypothetical protein
MGRWFGAIVIHCYSFEDCQHGTVVDLIPNYESIQGAHGLDCTAMTQYESRPLRLAKQATAANHLPNHHDGIPKAWKSVSSI